MKVKLKKEKKRKERNNINRNGHVLFTFSKHFSSTLSVMHIISFLFDRVSVVFLLLSLSFFAAYSVNFHQHCRLHLHIALPLLLLLRNVHIPISISFKCVYCRAGSENIHIGVIPNTQSIP